MRIVISDKTEPEIREAMAALGEVVYQPPDLATALKEADVLIVRSATIVTAELLGRAPQLKVVARAGMGLDNIDVAACVKKNIKVLNTPGASANAVAELAIGMMFVLLRQIPRAHTSMKQKQWVKKDLLGQELQGKTIGVIGFGRIGSLVAEKVRALGCTVLAYDPQPRETDTATFVPLGTLLAQSDIVSLHAVLTDETKNMLDAAALAQMKPTAYLINIARGELVDEEALYVACKEGRLAGAALDVYAHEPYTGKLLELDNITFTPHLGASTKEAQLRIGEELVGKLKAALS